MQGNYRGAAETVSDAETNLIHILASSKLADSYSLSEFRVENDSYHYHHFFHKQKTE